MLFITVFLVSCVFALIYLYFNWNNDYWQKRGVIGPKPELFFGNFRKSYLNQQHIAYDFEDFYNKYRGKTPYVGVFRNKVPQLLLLDPELVKTVLINNFGNFRDNELSAFIDHKSDPILFRNPFFATGEYWKEKRTEVVPGFTQNKLRSVFPIMKEISAQLQQYIKNKVESSSGAAYTFEVKDLAEKFTADVVSNTIFGIDSNEFQSDSVSQMRRMGASIITYKILKYTNLVNVLPFIKKFYKMTLTSKPVENFFYNLMEDSIKMRKDNKIQRDDFLNFLLDLQKRKNLSQMDMTAHAVVLFINGFESASGGIANTLFELASHPQIQSRLRKELKHFVDTHGEINADNINDIQYLDQVFNEAERLHPSVASMTKVCTVPTEFTDYKDKKVLIEKGTHVIIPTYPIQRDEEYYPNPTKFDPERFSEENGGLKHYKDKGVYLVFGDGPRICYGMKFAILQVKTAVAAILQNYELSLNAKSSGGFVCDPRFAIMVPLNGYFIDFKPV